MGNSPSADYVVGYVDANGRFKARPRPSFSVSGDRGALNIIRGAIGAEGRLRALRVKGRVYWRLEYSSHSDLLKVARFFDANPPLVRAEEYEEFRRALEKWKPRVRVPTAVAEEVRRMYEEGLPLEVIAEKLNLPMSSVGSIVYRRYRLRTRLGDRAGIVSDYLAGKPVKRIAEERGLRVSAVYEILRKKLGMSVIEGDVVSALARGAMSAEELAAELDVTPNALSPVLGRLAAKGMVRKADGRWEVETSCL